MAEAIAALILAAGRGTRFGPEPKLLADLDGRPLVRHAAEAALASRLRPVVAILGAHAADMRAALRDLDLTCVENPDYADGLSTSLKTGLAALPGEIAAAVILLGDMPRITGADLDRLADAFADADPAPAAVVPVHAGRRGNPVLLNLRRLGPALAALSGDRGAGPLLAGRDDVLEVAGTAGTGFDVDTPEALTT
ncbi:nucleotidyltransferase family protein [Methylobacterium durans]|uniref:4-diphosphocytidyl-2C-methyl-D-erythritol kinase n=1 Tax=Methylobacterium durans TaxID=2202825 RepID=A0A2U8W5V4_9HYPH|nr:nucleotidyltransferase family protein [Methylobacterium durans]AWN41485.1 4-diphosphocytidyl-2C-methyl-D-erythritol kinase [Methylobacterium durans]